MRPATSLLATYSLFLGSFVVALTQSPGVFPTSVLVPNRTPVIAPDQRALIGLRTGRLSVRGLFSCDETSLDRPRFVPSESQTSWDFHCDSEAWGHRITFRSDETADKALVVRGFLVAPPDAPAGRLRGRLLGTILAPIRNGDYFENRAVEISQVFDVQVLSREAYRARRIRQITLFWLSVPLILTSLGAGVVIAEKHKARAGKR